MDENFDTVETSSDSTELSFGKEIAKSFVISTAVSAGVIVGFAAIGLAINKFDEMKKKRDAKKAAKLETVKDN